MIEHIDFDVNYVQEMTSCMQNKDINGMAKIVEIYKIFLEAEKIIQNLVIEDIRSLCNSLDFSQKEIEKIEVLYYGE